MWKSNISKWGGFVLATAALVAGAGMVLAQAPPAKQPAQQPAQPPAQQPAPAPGWGAAVTRPPTAPPAAPPAQAGVVLDAQQIDTIKKVGGYFNDLKNMRGNFVQTGGDGKRMRGKFYFKQGGRFRFEYGFGSKMLIVSDGTNLAIQDLDIKTDDRIELDRTPFRMLLKKDVDLLRDARILDVQEVEDLIILAIADKNPDAAGSIRLFMTKKPVLELREWVTTDAQGLDTRVEINDISKTEELAADLFKIINPTLLKN